MSHLLPCSIVDSTGHRSAEVCRHGSTALLNKVDFMVEESRLRYGGGDDRDLRSG